MKKSFYGMVNNFSGLSNIALKATMKNGKTLDMGEFDIVGNTIYSKNGHKALLNDVEYIELESRK